MSRALLVDAGNSRVKWALAEDGRIVADGVFVHADTAAQCATLERLAKPASAWISNVAGAAAAARIAALVETAWPGLTCHWVRAQARQGGVTNGYADPSQLGSDRWCGLIGARAAYPGEHLLIATLGTATTIEALRADGHFVGGLIAPGWSLMMDSLGQHTAQLPTLDAAEIQRARHMPGAAAQLGGAFACDTRSALGEGCRMAQAAFVEYACREAAAVFEGAVRCILGGGAADAIGPALQVPYTRHDGLVLAGLGWMATEQG